MTKRERTIKSMGLVYVPGGNPKMQLEVETVEAEPSKVKNIIIDECYKCGSEFDLRQVAIRRLEPNEVVRDKGLINIAALCKSCVEKLKKRDEE